MSFLKFDKKLMINLEQSLSLEVLRTNYAGAYHSSTVVGCNTRKHHGLLVAPIREMDNRTCVLLSSLDETVIQHGAPFNLGIHCYKGGVYSPNGHKYIREFDYENVPRTTYRVGGVILTKETIFISHESRILIRYTLVDAHSPTILQFRPFLAFREAAQLCVENDNADTSAEEVRNGIACRLYNGYPKLYMQLSRKPEWHPEPIWYKNIEYVKDLLRGVPYSEDLLVPGYLEVPIKRGETIIFSAGLSEVSPRQLSAMYEKEFDSRTRRTSFYNCLKNAAKQFYFNDGDDNYLISAYPWGVLRARNTFIALPGSTLSIRHEQDFDKIMYTAMMALSRYMDTFQTDHRLVGLDLPDVPLWAAWAIQQYAKTCGMEAAVKNYRGFVARIVNFVIDGRHPNLSMESNGLVYTVGTSKPVSWMDSVDRSTGRPLIARTGYLVEFNALWYNALRFALAITEGGEKYASDRKKWEEIADNLKESFVKTFLNDAGYLYDYVSGNFSDPSVRPNMAIAIGLDYSPLDRRQRKGVLDVVTRELLTPKGLRTLSPKSYGYLPFYSGSPEERNMAYYAGPARPWLFGFYADAYIKVFGMSGVSYIDRMLIGYEEEISQGCIGTLSEMYDGNPPYSGHGAISYNLNVAEVLRVLRTLKKLTK